MKCRKCNNEVERGASYCPYCGETMSWESDDKPSFLVALVSFINPIIGLILYFLLYKDSPMKAKSATKGAIAGLITGTILGFLFFVLYMIIIGSILI